ncbi:MAG TPA: BMP family ABC transporter substrate-binding protein, partial [Actinomycetota bacterium]|nr:BMP family ABC transporter substrate-binding protein [Actinomycetota bacterium]
VACANNNSPGPSASGGGGGKPGAGKKGCFVTDTAGINDKSFNQTSYQGLKDKATELGATSQYLQSKTQEDYVPNIQAFLDQSCDLIETNGFLLGPATETAVKANPDQKFSIIDYDFFDRLGKDISYPNARELTFQTDQAAFLAGYLAAGLTKSGTVATFGGLNIPTVTIFENGFAAGIRKYNQDNGTTVKLIGWDPGTKKGTFAGGADPFQDEDAGRRIGKDLIDEGADIILPVAGGTGLGAAAAAQDAGNIAMFWVDNDGCVIASDFCSLFITSVVKHVDVASADTFASVVDGTFVGGRYVGTLANDGIGLAPYHEWATKVPQELKFKVEELKSGIISGDVSVDPRDYPA